MKQVKQLNSFPFEAFQKLCSRMQLGFNGSNYVPMCWWITNGLPAFRQSFHMFTAVTKLTASRRILSYSYSSYRTHYYQNDNRLPKQILKPKPTKISNHNTRGLKSRKKPRKCIKQFFDGAQNSICRKLKSPNILIFPRYSNLENWRWGSWDNVDIKYWESMTHDFIWMKHDLHVMIS